MAWQARLAAPIAASNDSISAVFEFFDDADATTVLAAASFMFSPTWTNSDMQKAVQARGAQLRAAKVRADALAQSFPPVSTVIAIP
jgi:hypothetical protein